MKRNQKGAKRRRRQIRVWSLEQTRAALPYLSSVVRSLREHRLEAVAQHRTAERLAHRAGRPDRDTLIAHAEAVKAAEQADERFRETLAELEALDIFLIDPIAGQTLIPFAHDENLAWYVYDAFDPEPIRFWRYHNDPLDTRRPLAIHFTSTSTLSINRVPPNRTATASMTCPCKRSSGRSESASTTAA